MAHQHGSPTSRGRRGHGRQRARRGAVVDAVLLLLDERPMHGYELITEMTERSAGRWEPSPGTIYPALNRMAEHGLVEATEIDGKRRYALTARGRDRLDEYRRSHDDAEAPWSASGTGRRGDLRGKLAELAGQARQIGRFGSPDQSEQAGVVLDEAVRKLYAVLAAEATTATATDSTIDTPSDTATESTEADEE
jgi:DNA-binding PadR family transcriptional regulator